MRILVETPLNPLSLGNVGYNIVKELIERDIDVGIWPVGNVDLKAYNVPDHIGKKIESGIQDRFYYLYSPENLDSNESIPVLFALHGYGSSASRHLSYTNYFSIADTNNFIVIFINYVGIYYIPFLWNIPIKNFCT